MLSRCVSLLYLIPKSCGLLLCADCDYLWVDSNDTDADHHHHHH